MDVCYVFRYSLFPAKGCQGSPSETKGNPRKEVTDQDTETGEHIHMCVCRKGHKVLTPVVTSTETTDPTRTSRSSVERTEVKQSTVAVLVGNTNKGKGRGHKFSGVFVHVTMSHGERPRSPFLRHGTRSQVTLSRLTGALVVFQDRSGLVTLGLRLRTLRGLGQGGAWVWSPPVQCGKVLRQCLGTDPEVPDLDGQ